MEEWKELLKDVDTSIRQYLVKDLSQRPQVRKLLSKKDTLFVATNTGMVTGKPHHHRLIAIDGMADVIHSLVDIDMYFAYGHAM